MRYLIAAVALTALLGTGAARAQTELDHNVQRTWDSIFHPDPPGDPRTNWERHRDDAAARERAEGAAYQRRRDAEHAEWCHTHPGVGGCGPY